MKNLVKEILTILFITGIGGSQLISQNTTDTRLMHSPAISDNHIAFIYAEDLWVANKDGSNPRRLTIDEGIERNPVFSPDGSQIAFSAEYDGNIDVFTMPVSGGVPKRLSWHPEPDIVYDFSVEGDKVLFGSQRNTHTYRFVQLYTVSVSGGKVEQLPIPTATNASYSAEGDKIAYSPLGEAFGQWKNYRGGRQSRIWVYSTSDHEVEEIPKPESGSNDVNPQWIDKTVYFRSDRNGEFNLFSYNLDNNKLTQHTQYEDFPVISLKSNGTEIIYEQAGYLHLFNPATGDSKRLQIGIATDLLELRTRFVSGSNYVRSASISPSGARVVFDFRGEVVTLPAKKGDMENLSQSPGVHEKYPEWSPDGKHIAWFSNESGEYQLFIRSNKDGTIKKMDIPGAGFYAYIHWAPDSKKLCFVDNSRTLFMADLDANSISEIDSDIMYVPGVFRELFGSWSFDSKWISYTIITETSFERAYAYSIEEQKSRPLSDGLSNVTEPVFDPSGKYAYMLASTDAGPVVNWFAQSNQDMEMSNSIYLLTLQKDLVSPLAKENEEEEVKDEEEKDDGKESEEEKEKELKIDWEGIENRIINLPLGSGMYSSLNVPAEGQIYYLSRKANSGFGTPQSLRKYNLKERKDEEIMQANGFSISANGKKMLYWTGSSSMGITDVGQKPKNGRLNISSIKVKIDPGKEWENIFEEAWRVNRDYFYDPGMHGLDWNATKEKYKPFLTDISCRGDLYRMMQWMFSELAVGHHRFSSRGDRMNNPERVSGGLLGADYEVAFNRYRFKKIYGGLNWTPNLRSPLTEPGVNVNEGEYLLAVNGQILSADDNLYSYFENTSGKIVELTVGPNPDFSESRKVKVVPIGNEISLRNRAWVEGNIKKVDEATNGQVAYVYVPNTAGAGHQYFKRYFFPQANKKAIIIDERYNGGGQLADYYIDILRRPYQAHWNFRYGKDLETPSGAIQGPKVMIIDETAGSGGDYLPWMFRKFGLGKLIGKRTWGGLVGVLGYPEFIDGGSVTAPNVAFWNEEGFRIENEGIAPDIEIEQWPKDIIEGKDPQLDKAIEVALEELKNNPPQKHERPDYPVRVRK